MSGARWPVRLFRAALRAFPARFRDVYAADMETCFRERWGSTRGAAARASFMFRTMANLAVNGIAERWRSSFADPDAKGWLEQEPRGLRGGLVSTLVQDVRYALRILRREPGYTAFVVLTLAVGVGANTAVFSVVDGVLLKPLPFQESHRLVAVWSRFDPESGFDFPRFVLSAPEFVDYRAQSRALEDVAAWRSLSLTVGGAGSEPERVDAAAVTPNLFSVLRVAPAAGRPFADEESRPGGPPVALLGYDYWQSRFAGGPDVVGRAVPINGVAVTIVGILPRGFSFPDTTTRIWTPLRIDPKNPGNRKGHNLRAIGRLAPAVSLDEAHAEMRTLMAAWKAQYPDVHTGHYLFIRPLLDDVAGTIRPALVLLLGATGFVLLIVCANLATIVLARGEARAREMAIRGALGARRSRLVVMSLVECTLLAAAGGALGLALAHAGVRALLAIDPAGVPRAAEIGLDARMLLFAALVSVASVLIFGLAPAIRNAGTDLQPVLKESAHSTTAGAERQWLRRGLVAVEVALAVLLVTGAGLMLRSFNRLLMVPPGFEPQQLLMAGISLPVATYEDAGRVDAFYETLLSRIRGLPGVRAASATTGVPMWSDSGVWDFDMEGRPKPGAGQMAWNAGVIIVRPGFFETLRIPVKRGRVFEDRDGARGMPVTVINEAMAARFFAGEDPIGRRIRVAGSSVPDNWMTIIGVCGDVRDQSLAEEPRPIYYIAQAQMPAVSEDVARALSLVIRADGSPEQIAGSVRAAVRQLDASLPVFDVQTVDTIIERSTAQPRFTTVLLSLFALVGIVLGASGVYGVLAYTVARRSREIGIRRALGANQGAVVRSVIGGAMGPVAAGLVAGFAAALWLMRLLESQLFGVAATDPATYAAVATAVLVISLVACIVPTLRALKVDALVAMRAA